MAILIRMPEIVMGCQFHPVFTACGAASTTQYEVMPATRNDDVTSSQSSAVMTHLVPSESRPGTSKQCMKETTQSAFSRLPNLRPWRFQCSFQLGKTPLMKRGNGNSLQAICD
ncbi:uncharacterized protein LOC144023468 isoform X2 [Festucalex cinctus]